jgi:hypothetical protein
MKGYVFSVMEIGMDGYNFIQPRSNLVGSTKTRWLDFNYVKGVSLVLIWIVVSMMDDP